MGVGGGVSLVIFMRVLSLHGLQVIFLSKHKHQNSLEVFFLIYHLLVPPMAGSDIYITELISLLPVQLNISQF